MPREIRFQFPLKFGLHARPASHLQAIANRFKSKVELVNQRTSQRANAKSVLSMVSADVRANDPCLISIEGADEESAEREFKRFLNYVLPHVDDELPTPATSESGEGFIPRSLRAAGLKEYFRGISV